MPIRVRKPAYESYDKESASLNPDILLKATEPLKHDLLQITAGKFIFSEQQGSLRKLVFIYFVYVRIDKYAANPAARLNLGNSSSLQQVHIDADQWKKGIIQSRGAKANYLFDPINIEANHERLAIDGHIEFHN